MTIIKVQVCNARTLAGRRGGGTRESDGLAPTPDSLLGGSVTLYPGSIALK